MPARKQGKWSMDCFCCGRKAKTGHLSSGALLGEMRLLQAMGLRLYSPPPPPQLVTPTVAESVSPPTSTALLLSPPWTPGSLPPWAGGDGNWEDSGIDIIIMSIGENMPLFSLWFFCLFWFRFFFFLRSAQGMCEV